MKFCYLIENFLTMLVLNNNFAIRFCKNALFKIVKNRVRLFFTFDGLQKVLENFKFSHLDHEFDVNHAIY